MLWKLQSDLLHLVPYPCVAASGGCTRTEDDYGLPPPIVWFLKRNAAGDKEAFLRGSEVTSYSHTAPWEEVVGTADIPRAQCHQTPSTPPTSPSGCSKLSPRVDSIRCLVEVDQDSSCLKGVWQALERTLLSMFVPGVARRILEAVPDLPMLENARFVNKNFYKAYQDNALSLIRGALRRMCPPAWELREMGLPWASPGSVEYLQCLTMRERPVPTVTPTNYLDHYAYEASVIAQVMGAIFTSEQQRHLCGHERALAAVHDACLRIWTFCRIFGGGKGREGDWEGQQEWLAGGTRAHQPSGCAVSGWGWNSEVLDLAPESFGKGNHDGLSARQITLMLVIWDLLRQKLRWKVRSHLQAHSRGEPDEGAVDKWISSVLTLGLAAVDHLLLSDDPVLEAARLGWAVLSRTTVALPEQGTFLRDACSRRLQHLSARSLLDGVR